MQIKINFEMLALSKLVQVGDQELFLALSPKLFSGHYQSLYKLVEKEFSNTHKIPSMKLVEGIINDRAPNTVKPTLLAILNAMSETNLDTIGNDQLLQGLKDKHLLVAVDENIQELNNLAMLKDTAGVRQVLNKITEEINLDAVVPVDFMVAMEAEDKSRIISSGIDDLDEHLGGGVAGLTIISGSSGGGKSIMLGQMAVGQYMKGYNILYVSLELSAQTMGNRIKSYLTGINFNKINKDKGAALSEEDRTSIKEKMSDFGGRDNVFRIVTTPLDTNELLNLIKVESSLYNIDIIYIDYLNLVAAPRGVQSGWQNIADTAKALHRLSMQLGVITISASQVTLDKAPKAGKYPEVTTRGSKELEFSATLWLFIYSPDSDEEAGNTDSAVIYILKNRNGPKAQLLMTKCFSQMHFEFIMAL